MTKNIKPQPNQPNLKLLITACAVLAVSAAGLAVWRLNSDSNQNAVYSNQIKAQPVAEEPAATAIDDKSVTDTKSEESLKSKKIVVPGIGFEFEVPEGMREDLKDLTFHQKRVKDDVEEYVAVYVSSKELEKYDREYCSAKMGPLGAFGKMSGQYKDAPPERFPGLLVKQFDDYFISYEGSQAACSDDKKAQELQTKGSENLRKAIGAVYPN